MTTENSDKIKEELLNRFNENITQAGEILKLIQSTITLGDLSRLEIDKLRKDIYSQKSSLLQLIAAWAFYLRLTRSMPAFRMYIALLYAVSMEGIDLLNKNKFIEAERHHAASEDLKSAYSDEGDIIAAIENYVDKKRKTTEKSRAQRQKNIDLIKQKLISIIENLDPVIEIKSKANLISLASELLDEHLKSNNIHTIKSVHDCVRRWIYSDKTISEIATKACAKWRCNNQKK